MAAADSTVKVLPAKTYIHIHQAKIFASLPFVMASQGTPSCLPPTRNKGIGLVSGGGYVQGAR